MFHPLAGPKRRRRRDDGAEDEGGGAKEEGAACSALPSLWGEQRAKIVSERLRTDQTQGAGHS